MPWKIVGKANDPATGERVVSFCRMLRQQGIHASPHDSQSALQALSWVDADDDEQAYYALRCVLVKSKKDWEVFKKAFERHWCGYSPSSEDHVTHQPPVSHPGPTDALITPVPLPNIQELHQAYNYSTGEYSRMEILRQKDFSLLSDREEQQIILLLKQLQWKPWRWRTRRMERQNKIDRLDWRRTIRAGLKFGGETMQLIGHGRKQSTPKLIFLVDISGSMEKYTRILLHLLHHLHAEKKFLLESFLFGTRLTFVSPKMRGRDAYVSIQHLGTELRDWSAGTRIGESLKQFNDHWSSRTLRGKAVVIIVSDGLDRGDLNLLGVEMRRLQMNCHRLLWLNPLMGGHEYRPIAGGMSLSMPYIDDFLPLHNFESLAGLNRALERVPKSRTSRAQKPYQSSQLAPQR